MRAGNLDKKIEIQVYSAGAEDAFGADVENWTELSKVWASVDYGSGQERRAAASQEVASITAIFTIRYSIKMSQIKPGSHRVVFDGMDWDIIGVPPGHGRRESLKITARART